MEIHGTEDSFGRPQDAQPLCHPGGRRVVNCSSEQQCGTDGHYGADDDILEQTALDSGRTQLSWLLTGLQDPPYHLLVNHRRRPGMEPFSRLCAPSWISANLAYVKDLDYIEARMRTWENLPKQPSKQTRKFSLVRSQSPDPKARGRASQIRLGRPRMPTMQSSDLSALQSWPHAQ